MSAKTEQFEEAITHFLSQPDMQKAIDVLSAWLLDQPAKEEKSRAFGEIRSALVELKRSLSRQLIDKTIPPSQFADLGLLYLVCEDDENTILCTNYGIALAETSQDPAHYQDLLMLKAFALLRKQEYRQVFEVTSRLADDATLSLPVLGTLVLSDITDLAAQEVNEQVDNGKIWRRDYS